MLGVYTFNRVEMGVGMAQTADEFESLRAEIARLLAAASRERTFHARQMHDEQRRHDAQVAEMLDGYDDETKRVMDAVRSMIDVGEAPAADVQRIHDETVADLQRTLAASDVIGQAKGIIMVTMHCTADAAFDLLRDQSQL